jgi:hypothetical protein
MFFELILHQIRISELVQTQRFGSFDGRGRRASAHAWASALLIGALHHHCGTAVSHLLLPDSPRNTEIEMSAKLLPALALGLLVGTTALASAQTTQARQITNVQRDLVTPVVQRGVPYYGYYADPYYGTPFENVAPYSAYGQPNPYRGTVYDNVAPY